MFEIRKLHIQLGGNLIIDDFNLVVNNEIVAIIGKSGCGKTTILNAIAKIIPSDDAIYLNDKLIDPKDDNIGFVMQELGLLPWLNVRDNCLLPYKIKKISIDEEVVKRLDDVSKILQIDTLLDRSISSLSGGQSQRVALARLFTYNPDLILLDEAFSSLDLFNKEEAINHFIKIWKTIKVPTIIVTHSIDEALLMAHKIVVIKEKGEIIDVVENPLVFNSNYKKALDYGGLYFEIESVIKGEYHEK